MTDILAWAGVASLGWQIFEKVTSGARLAVEAFPNFVQRRPMPPGDPKFLSIRIKNQGSGPTTITGVSLETYQSFWKRKILRPTWSAVLADYEAELALPVKLEVGEEWIALMPQNDEFNSIYQAGNLWCVIHHTFSKRPVMVKIAEPHGRYLHPPRRFKGKNVEELLNNSF